MGKTGRFALTVEAAAWIEKGSRAGVSGVGAVGPKKSAVGF